LRLAPLIEDALRADPRQRQLELHSKQTELRLRNMAVELLPAVTAEAVAQHQSDVAEFPFRGPAAPSPPRDTYDAYLRADQRLFDPTLGPRRAAERAQLAESQARVRAALRGVREDVQEAYFAAALLQERATAVATTLQDLEARLREATARVREGTALRSEAASIEATLLERREALAELHANRQAALERLAILVRRPLDAEATLAVPDHGDAVVRARARAEHRARPEYEQFASSRERLARQGDAVAAREIPSLSAFGRLGYARPGQRVFAEQFDEYWMAGVQLRWALWTWGSSARERRALRLQQEMVAADETAFTESIARALQADLATMDRLDTTLVIDDRIVTLRESIERESRLRLEEGVVTAAEYLDRNTDLLEARLTRAGHRVELAQARARFLTRLGLEVR
jgi:outer membrane protein TolC